MKIVKVGGAVGGGIASARKEFGGRVRCDTSTGENKLPDRAGLGGDDNGAVVADRKSLLNLRHGLAGGEIGEAGGGVLAGEIAGGDLLDAGCGEEGNGDGGEQCGDEEDEDEGGTGIGGSGRRFNHGVHGGVNKPHGGAKDRVVFGFHGAAGTIGC